ncbi:MAG: hypothetical protein AB1774_08105 [Bacillota bacterium]
MKRKSTFPWTLTCAVALIGLLMGAGPGIAEAVAGPGKAGPNVSVNVSITVPAPELSLEETLFIGAMAAFFDMDVAFVTNLYCPASSLNIAITPTTPRITVSEPRILLSAIYVSKYYDADPLIVIDMKKKGHGWGEIAQQRGKGNKAKIKKNDRDFERDSFVMFVASYYAVPPAQIRKWLSMGMSEPEITFCLNLAVRAKVNPSVVISERRKGTSWEAIGAKYKIPKGDLAKLVKPVKKFGKTLP